MKRLLFGTTNPAKMAQIRGALAPLNIRVDGFETAPVSVVEDGANARENARKKASAYAQAVNEPVFAMDNGLYFVGLAPEQQPGIHVRRINKESDRPSDQELLEHYTQLVKSLGRQVDGWWEFAVCLALPDGRLSETIIESHRTFVDQPCPKIVDGYPLESIQIDPESGKYIADMSQEEQAVFWQRMIGQPLAAFIRSAIEELHL